MNKGERIVWRTLKAKLIKGQTLGEASINLEKGERIYAAASSSQEPGKIIDLGLYENNQKVSEPMDLSFWKRNPGSGLYLDGFKPLEITGGAIITARISTVTPFSIDTDLEIEIVFAVIQKCQ